MNQRTPHFQTLARLAVGLTFVATVGVTQLAQAGEQHKALMPKGEGRIPFKENHISSPSSHLKDTQQIRAPSPRTASPKKHKATVPQRPPAISVEWTDRDCQRHRYHYVFD